MNQGCLSWVFDCLQTALFTCQCVSWTHLPGHTLALLSEGVAESGCKLLPKSPRAQVRSLALSELVFGRDERVLVRVEPESKELQALVECEATAL